MELGEGGAARADDVSDLQEIQGFVDECRRGDLMTAMQLLSQELLLTSMCVRDGGRQLMRSW
jgi:hypothetical protein